MATGSGDTVSSQLRVDLSQYKAELREADRLQAQSEERAAARAARIGRFLDESHQRSALLEQTVTRLQTQMKAMGKQLFRAGAVQIGASLLDSLDFGDTLGGSLTRIGGQVATGAAFGGLPLATVAFVQGLFSELMRAQQADRARAEQFRRDLDRNTERIQALQSQIEVAVQKAIEPTKAELVAEARRMREETEELSWQTMQYLPN